MRKRAQASLQLRQSDSGQELPEHGGHVGRRHAPQQVSQVNSSARPGAFDDCFGKVVRVGFIHPNVR